MRYILLFIAIFTFSCKYNISSPVGTIKDYSANSGKLFYTSSNDKTNDIEMTLMKNKHSLGKYLIKVSPTNDKSTAILTNIKAALDKNPSFDNVEIDLSLTKITNIPKEMFTNTTNLGKITLPDTIMCVPSFILKLIQYAEEHGIDYRNSSVKRIIGIGEGLREQDFSLNLLGRRIKEKWDVQLFATYSSTEMGATFSECEYGMGGHVHPELIIVEIIGEDDMPVADGEIGEVVVTTLGVEGMPLLRFRTGDMAAKRVEQCKCGRNSYRLTPLVGRKNNMIKLKGTTLYPPAVNDVLDNTDYVENYIVFVEDSEAGTDEVIVKVGLKGKPDFDAVKDLKDRFRSRIRVAPIVEILPPDEIAKMNFPAKSRKPVKFVDNRKHCVK